jgi:hypothetical protein
MIYFPGTINIVSTRLYCHIIYISNEFTSHFPAMHVNLFCACWHSEAVKGPSSLSTRRLLISLCITSSLFLCPEPTDAPCFHYGGSDPPLPKMAPLSTGSAHTPLSGSETLPLCGSGGSTLGIFLGLPLFLGFVPISTISASPFGIVTTIVRACFQAFFLEITFLYLAAGLFASSSSWAGWVTVLPGFSFFSAISAPSWPAGSGSIARGGTSGCAGPGSASIGGAGPSAPISSSFARSAAETCSSMGTIKTSLCIGLVLDIRSFHLAIHTGMHLSDLGILVGLTGSCLVLPEHHIPYLEVSFFLLPLGLLQLFWKYLFYPSFPELLLGPLYEVRSNPNRTAIVTPASCM